MVIFAVDSTARPLTNWFTAICGEQPNILAGYQDVSPHIGALWFCKEDLTAPHARCRRLPVACSLATGLPLIGYPRALIGHPSANRRSFIVRY
jgi:hypothetical protein